MSSTTSKQEIHNTSSKNSIVMSWKKYTNKRHLRIHKDFIAQLGIILLVIVATSFTYLEVTKKIESDTKAKDLFEINAVIATFCGLILTAANLHDQYHQEKMVKSSYYVESWYKNIEIKRALKILRDIKEEEFDNKVKKEHCKDLKEECIILARELKKKDPVLLESIQNSVLTILQTDRKKRKSVNEVLNFFEHMGQDVRFNVVDEEYLKEFFFQSLTNYFEILRKYVEFLQEKYSSKIVFCNFVYLANRWENSKVKPHLPKA